MTSPGLSRDWLSRHLPAVAPEATALPALRQPRSHLRLGSNITRLGFADVASYLRERHIARHWTVSAIAREAGVSPPTIRSALERHGLNREAHAVSRHEERVRAARVAAATGNNSVRGYIRQRRADGWTWRAIATESGQSESWLRRHASGLRSGVQ